MFKRIPIMLLLIAVIPQTTLPHAHAQEKANALIPSTEAPGIHFVSDQDLGTQADDMNLEILATVHKVAVTRELVDSTPEEERAKLGKNQFLLRLKITNRAGKPFYFNAINALMLVNGHPASKTARRSHPSMEALTEPYDLENFKPSKEQRVIAWKVDANGSLIMTINSEGDPYLFTDLDADRKFMLHLVIQMDGMQMSPFVTQLPLLQDLVLEEVDALGRGVLVKFEKLEAK